MSVLIETMRREGYELQIGQPQVIINLGVNMGILPTKGLTLPLISYGRSSLIITLMALALLLRIDMENRSIRSTSVKAKRGRRR